jgi:hypothetical protein
MAGGKGPNCGGRGQHARPTVTNEKKDRGLKEASPQQ